MMGHRRLSCALCALLGKGIVKDPTTTTVAAGCRFWARGLGFTARC